MRTALLAALVEQEVQTRIQTSAPIIEGCPSHNEPVMDGTGAHLGLRAPWWNDLSHEITDSTIFRLLLIAMVVDWILKQLG